MRPVVSWLAAISMWVPSIGAGEPPAFPAVVVNGPDRAVPVQGSVAVTDLPAGKASDAFDQSVSCSGNAPSYQCDAAWNAPVLIERVSAHCTGTGGSVWVLKLISSIGAAAPSTPAERLTASAGPNATAATTFEGARRFLPLASIPSLNANVAVTTLVPVSMAVLVPPERFLRLTFEGDMASASCFVAVSGRWLR
jgi:hypothetical protein